MIADEDERPCEYMKEELQTIAEFTCHNIVLYDRDVGVWERYQVSSGEDILGMKIPSLDRNRSRFLVVQLLEYSMQFTGFLLLTHHLTGNMLIDSTSVKPARQTLQTLHYSAQTHHGQATERSGTVVVELGGRPQIVKLQLSEDSLCVLKEELAYTQPPAESKVHSNNKERCVEVRREAQGGLGLSVKGGKEHQLPVLISRIFKDQAADKTGQLFVGDAILKVNEVSVEHLSHDQAVQVLKQAGEVVSLTVKYFRPASIFLSCQQGSSKSVSDAENGNPPGSPTSICDEVFHPEPHWTELLRIPLLCGYLIHHPPSSTHHSCESFEVVSMDGLRSGKIQCEEQSATVEWIHSIMQNIHVQNAQSILLTNRDLQPEQKVHFMTWVRELTSTGKSGEWRRMFLALKGSDVCLFHAPPIKTRDWVKCETITRLYEAMFSLDKVSSTGGGVENQFTVESGPDAMVRHLSVDSYTELMDLQKAWNSCTYQAITQIQSKSYSCVWQGHQCSLILDLQKGFALYDSWKKGYAWMYRFSQLKGSSDNGESRLTLQFAGEQSKDLQSQELQCVQLKTLLCAMQAFLYVKLTSVDPSFQLTQ